MNLVQLIVIISLVGLLCWAVTTLIPMPEPFKRAIYVLSVVFLVLFLLSGFGLIPDIGSIRIGK